MPDMIDAYLDIAYFEARDARHEVAARIKFEGRGLTLVTENEQGESVLWHGERRGQGHFVLSAPDADMEASLHRFADSTILEGFWRHGRERGFWRLHLPVEQVLTKPAKVRKLPLAKAKSRTKAPRKTARRAA